MPTLAQRLEALPDPRNASGLRHPLAAILKLTVTALACGFRSLLAIADFGRELDEAERLRLGFTHRKPKTREVAMPCVATLSNLFRNLDLAALEAQRRAAAAERLPPAPGPDAAPAPPTLAALDGKSVRGSADGEVPALHLLALFAVEAGLTLAQQPVDLKTNEHKAALAMLAGVDLHGHVVSADAMFTHRDFCQRVLDSGGDYLLVAKGNQSTLERDLRSFFADDPELSPLPTAAAC